MKPNTIDLFIDPATSTSNKAFENILNLGTDITFDLNVKYFTRNTQESEILRQICIRENTDQFIPYLLCIFDRTVDDETASFCMENLKIDVETIKTCTVDQTNLLEEDLEAANSFSINTVPTFVFNNQYKKGGSLSVDLLNDFYCKINKC